MSFPFEVDQYELLDIIGINTGCMTYLARCLSNNQFCAIKQIKLDEFPLDFTAIQSQTSAWINMNHPNIAKLYGLFVVDKVVWLIIELASCGSIRLITEFGYSRGFRDEVLISSILSQILSALKYLHEQKLVHHDLRANKVLITSNGVVKLADIGMNTSIVSSGSRKTSTLSLFGEECYMAPEVLKNENDYSQKSDIWSLGMIAIELGTGKMPYAGMKFMESLVRIIDNDPPSLPENGNFSPYYREFVKFCLPKVPLKRYSAKDLLNTKFIKLLAKGPEVIQRSIVSSLPSLSEMYKRVHSNKLHQKQSLTTSNAQEQPKEFTPQSSKTMGRFTVTRTDSSSSKVSTEQLNEEMEYIPKSEIEELAMELVTLTAEMEQLQAENSTLKQKMADVMAVIENIQEKRKNENHQTTIPDQ